MTQFTDHAVTDRRLVTGRNPAPATSAASQVVQALAPVHRLRPDLG